MTRLARPDGCGNCLTDGDGSVLVRPYFARPDGDDGGVRCWYRCPACGHSWFTSWGPRAPEVANQLGEAS